MQDALIRLQVGLRPLAVNAVFAAVVYAVAVPVLAAPLARSLSGDALFSGGAADALIEILTGSGPALERPGRRWRLALLGSLPVRLAVSLRRRAQRDRPAARGQGLRRFLLDGRRQVLRPLLPPHARLDPAVGPRGAALSFWPAAALTTAGVDPAREDLQFYLVLARIAVGLVPLLPGQDGPGLRPHPDRGPGVAQRPGRPRLGRPSSSCASSFKTLALYYLLGLTSLAGSAAYWVVQAAFARTTTAAVLAGFSLAQLHILWRCWVKVAYQAAELKLYPLEAH